MTTSNIDIIEKANLIWSIGDMLSGFFKPHEYGEVILPLTVIRRFDCILEKTKDASQVLNVGVNSLSVLRQVMRLDRDYRREFLCF